MNYGHLAPQFRTNISLCNLQQCRYNQSARRGGQRWTGKSRDFHTRTEVESETAEVNGDGTTATPSHQRHGAELLAEEPTQPRGRTGKPKPSSLFEWALCAEQERKKGPAGAGRWANRRRGDAAMRRPLVGCPCVRPFCVSGRRRLRVRVFLIGGSHYEKPVEVAHPQGLLNQPAGVRRGTALAGHQRGVSRPGTARTALPVRSGSG